MVSVLQLNVCFYHHALIQSEIAFCGFGSISDYVQRAHTGSVIKYIIDIT